MKVFVTGAAGFIGSHLVDKLVEEGIDVIAHDSLYRGKLQNISGHIDKKKIDFWEGDIRSFDQVKRLMEGCEAVYHLAAQSNVMGAVSDMNYSFETNVIGTFNLLKAASENKIRRFIFTSSREIYGEAENLPVSEDHPAKAKNAYGVSKLAGEKYVSLFAEINAFETVLLRLANVYGSRDFNRVIPIFIDNIRNNQDIRIFGGRQIIDFVSVKIIIEILWQSLQNGAAINQPINIGSGIGTTLFQLAEKIMKETGANCSIQTLPARNEEVERYTADTNNMKRIFKIEIPEDPLYHLAEIIN